MEYLAVYIRYNRWYRRVTKQKQDSVALRSLERRYVIWKDYLAGSCLMELRPLHGILTHNASCRDLIRAWYQVRCKVVHGEFVELERVGACAKSLRLFMDEIERRHSLICSLPVPLRTAYVTDEWAVDMIPVKTLRKLFTNY